MFCPGGRFLCFIAGNICFQAQCIDSKRHLIIIRLVSPGNCFLRECSQSDNEIGSTPIILFGRGNPVPVSRLGRDLQLVLRNYIKIVLFLPPMVQFPH